MKLLNYLTEMMENPFAKRIYRDIAKTYKEIGMMKEAEAFIELGEEIYGSTNHNNEEPDTNENP